MWNLEGDIQRVAFETVAFLCVFLMCEALRQAVAMDLFGLPDGRTLEALVWLDVAYIEWCMVYARR